MVDQGKNGTIDGDMAWMDMSNKQRKASEIEKMHARGRVLERELVPPGRRQ
jgi:hypothetical protein